MGFQFSALLWMKNTLQLWYIYISDASSIYENLYPSRHFVFKGAAASLAGRYIQNNAY